MMKSHLWHRHFPPSPSTLLALFVDMRNYLSNTPNNIRAAISVVHRSQMVIYSQEGSVWGKRMLVISLC